MKKETPHVVILGRPNVGKSTLFNRLYGKRRALVHDLPGVTRDRLIEKTSWHFQDGNVEITLIDTGGIGGETFAKEIEMQVTVALETADVALFVVDGIKGMTAADREIFVRFKKEGVFEKCTVIGVVNKIDTPKHEEHAFEFEKLGFKDLVSVSAEHGRGFDTLKKLILNRLLKSQKVVFRDEETVEEKEHIENAIPQIAIVGKPNVGKSTLVNSFLREKRMIVSPIAGTTVDMVDSYVEMNEKTYCLIDTAGIRRKNKTKQGVEVLSVVQTKKALERADLAILMLDGEEGPSDQDEKIGGLIEEVGCSVIIAVNKWDVQRKNYEFTQEVARDKILKQMPYLRYAPMIFISAKERYGLKELSPVIDKVLTDRKVKISTKEFTNWIRTRSEIHNPANVKFYLCQQVSNAPPTFLCIVSQPDKVHYTLRRNLVNSIRETWGFEGSPIRLMFKKSKNQSEKDEK